MHRDCYQMMLLCNEKVDSMKRVWMIAVFGLFQSGIMCTQQGNVEQPEMAHMREEAAQAIDEILSMVRVNRTVTDASYKSLEENLNPKTYKRILAAREKIRKLTAERDALLKSPYFGPDHDKTKRAEFDLIDARNEFEDLVRNESILHWRTFLALGIGMFVGVLSWRMNRKGIWGKSWRSVWYGFLVTNIVELALRTRHAVVPGLVFKGLKKLFTSLAKGAEKVFGTQGTSDRAGRWFEEIIDTKVGRDIDKALKGPLGPALASLITIGALVAAFKLTKNRKPSKKVDEE